MRFAIIRFPGSNCDRDCHHVLQNVMGVAADYVWHRESSLQGFDAVVLPGGFSYGDYLRCGAVAKLSPVMSAVADFAARGGPVIGICNGFQILLETGLLPGAMLRNRSLRFICKPVALHVESTRSPFTSRYEVGQQITLPIAHAEGNYTIDDNGLARLQDEDCIVMRYAQNPNGSVDDIAGICNPAGNVVGLMPHPERAAEAVLGGSDGLAMFAGAVDFVASRGGR